ncbi:uncharacterized protein VP01_10015g1, partial [Puccinia sorghi]
STRDRKLGPFKIDSVVSKKAFKLSLPSNWKVIHLVVHVSLLEPAKGLYPGKSHPQNLSIFRTTWSGNLKKIELPGNTPTIFKTPPTWFKTFIPLILKNLVK